MVCCAKEIRFRSCSNLTFNISTFFNNNYTRMYSCTIIQHVFDSCADFFLVSTASNLFTQQRGGELPTRHTTRMYSCTIIQHVFDSCACFFLVSTASNLFTQQRGGGKELPTRHTYSCTIIQYVFDSCADFLLVSTVSKLFTQQRGGGKELPTRHTYRHILDYMGQISGVVTASSAIRSPHPGTVRTTQATYIC
jgi:hypothetical protein